MQRTDGSRAPGGSRATTGVLSSYGTAATGVGVERRWPRRMVAGMQLPSRSRICEFLRPTEANLAWVVGLYTSAVVRRYLGGRVSIIEAEERIRTDVLLWDTDNFGPWIVRDRDRAGRRVRRPLLVRGWTQGGGLIPGSIPSGGVRGTDRPLSRTASTMASRGSAETRSGPRHRSRIKRRAGYSFALGSDAFPKSSGTANRSPCSSFTARVALTGATGSSQYMPRALARCSRGASVVGALLALCDSCSEKDRDGTVLRLLGG